eukprot:GHVS01013191.1.p1 GENE.GHVS01013191.1~~GHVS01013191.1.p1  ORF type:complete len:357 (+),score=67.35 GHVS01013191.1:199-1269(+)
MRSALEGLHIAMVQLPRRDDLTYAEWYDVASAIVNSTPEEMDGVVGMRLSCLLGMMRMKGESSCALTAFSNKLRETIEQPLTSNPSCLDIVGTGGDGLNTINISTGAAIVAAAAGVPVMKFGAVGSSSSSGSADVLAALGISFCSSSSDARECLSSVGIAFCSANSKLAAWGHVRKLRRNLSIPTIFNLVGPLVNVCLAGYRMIGVFDITLLETFGRVVQQSEDTTRALLFHGQGLDELSPVGPAEVVEVTADKTIKRWTFDPIDYGIPYCLVDDLKGSSPEGNAAVLREIFSGSVDNQHGAVRDALLINAGVGVWLTGKAPSIAEGIGACRDVLKSGAVLSLLDRWSSWSPSLHQ